MEERAPHAGEHHFIRILVDLFVNVREIQVLGIRPGIIVQVRDRFRLRKAAGRGKRIARDAISRVEGRQPFGMLVSRVGRDPAAVVVQMLKDCLARGLDAPFLGKEGDGLVVGMPRPHHARRVRLVPENAHHFFP